MMIIKCLNLFPSEAETDALLLSRRFYFAEAEAWFVDSLEAWRKAKKLENFILLGHSLGGYVAAKYALKVRK
jgi:pimeloyl-ACP methyl ester carboxylesterase